MILARKCTKDKPHVTNLGVVEDPPDVDNDVDLIEELTFYTF